MELIELSKEERLDVYNNHMTKDFHASELKPLDMIESLVEKGNYAGYGFYESDIFLGYAFFTKTNQGENLIIDYLAVCSGRRSKGFGTKFIKTLNNKFKNKYSSLLAEVENPDFTDDQDEKRIREKRISFYLRNGFTLSSVLTHVLVDDYIIISLKLDRELSDDEISDEMNEIYQVSFGEEYCEKNISVSISIK